MRPRLAEERTFTWALSPYERALKGNLVNIARGKFTAKDIEDYGLDIPELYRRVLPRIKRTKAPRILIVSERRFQSAALAVMMERFGAKVRLAKSGRIAYTVYLKHYASEFDLVICDWDLPDIGGRDLVYYNREQQGSLVFLAALPPDMNPCDALRSGADLYLRAPLWIHMHTLRELLLPNVESSYGYPNEVMQKHPNHQTLKQVLESISNQSDAEIEHLNKLVGDDIDDLAHVDTEMINKVVEFIQRRAQEAKQAAAEGLSPTSGGRKSFVASGIGGDPLFVKQLKDAFQSSLVIINKLKDENAGLVGKLAQERTQNRQALAAAATAENPALVGDMDPESLSKKDMNAYFRIFRRNMKHLEAENDALLKELEQLSLFKVELEEAVAGKNIVVKFVEAPQSGFTGLAKSMSMPQSPISTPKAAPNSNSTNGAVIKSSAIASRFRDVTAARLKGLRSLRTSNVPSMQTIRRKMSYETACSRLENMMMANEDRVATSRPPPVIVKPVPGGIFRPIPGATPFHELNSRLVQGIELATAEFNKLLVILGATHPVVAPKLEATSKGITQALLDCDFSKRMEDAIAAFEASKNESEHAKELAHAKDQLENERTKFQASLKYKLTKLQKVSLKQTAHLVEVRILSWHFQQWRRWLLYKENIKNIPLAPTEAVPKRPLDMKTNADLRRDLVKVQNELDELKHTAANAIRAKATAEEKSAKLEVYNNQLLTSMQDKTNEIQTLKEQLEKRRKAVEAVARRHSKSLDRQNSSTLLSESSGFGTQLDSSGRKDSWAGNEQSPDPVSPTAKRTRSDSQALPAAAAKKHLSPTRSNSKKYSAFGVQGKEAEIPLQPEADLVVKSPTPTTIAATEHSRQAVPAPPKEAHRRSQVVTSEVAAPEMPPRNRTQSILMTSQIGASPKPQPPPAVEAEPTTTRTFAQLSQVPTTTTSIGNDVPPAASSTATAHPDSDHAPPKPLAAPSEPRLTKSRSSPNVIQKAPSRKAALTVTSPPNNGSRRRSKVPAPDASEPLAMKRRSSSHRSLSRTSSKSDRSDHSAQQPAEGGSLTEKSEANRSMRRKGTMKKSGSSAGSPTPAAVPAVDPPSQALPPQTAEQIVSLRLDLEHQLQSASTAVQMYEVKQQELEMALQESTRREHLIREDLSAASLQAQQARRHVEELQAALENASDEEGVNVEKLKERLATAEALQKQYEAQVEELRMSYEASHAEEVRRRTEMEELLASLTHSASTRRDDVSRLEAELEDAKGDESDLRKRLQLELKQAREDAAEHDNRVIEQAAAMEASDRAGVTALDLLQKQLNDASSSALATKKFVGDLQTVLSADSSDPVELRRQIHLLITTARNTAAEHESREKELLEALRTAAETESQLRLDFAKQLDSVAAESARYLSTVRTLEQTLIDATGERETSQRETIQVVRELQRQVAEEKDTTNRLQVENADLREQLQKLRMELWNRSATPSPRPMGHSSKEIPMAEISHSPDALLGAGFGVEMNHQGPTSGRPEVSTAEPGVPDQQQYSQVTRAEMKSAGLQTSFRPSPSPYDTGAEEAPKVLPVPPFLDNAYMGSPIIPPAPWGSPSPGDGSFGLPRFSIHSEKEGETSTRSSQPPLSTGHGRGSLQPSPQQHVSPVSPLAPPPNHSFLGVAGGSVNVPLPLKSPRLLGDLKPIGPASPAQPGAHYAWKFDLSPTAAAAPPATSDPLETSTLGAKAAAVVNFPSASEANRVLNAIQNAAKRLREKGVSIGFKFDAKVSNPPLLDVVKELVRGLTLAVPPSLPAGGGGGIEVLSPTTRALLPLARAVPPITFRPLDEVPLLDPPTLHRGPYPQTSRAPHVAENIASRLNRELLAHHNAQIRRLHPALKLPARLGPLTKPMPNSARLPTQTTSQNYQQRQLPAAGHLLHPLMHPQHHDDVPPISVGIHREFGLPEFIPKNSARGPPLSINPSHAVSLPELRGGPSPKKPQVDRSYVPGRPLR